MIKSNLQKQEFILAYSSRVRKGPHDRRQRNDNRRPEHNVMWSHLQPQAEENKLEVGWGNELSDPPVMGFLQQVCTPQTFPDSAAKWKPSVQIIEPMSDILSQASRPPKTVT